MKEKCQKSRDGKHEASSDTGVVSRDVYFVVDYNCKHCGQSGAAVVDPKEIVWD